MRRVDDTASLVAAIRAASGEALASFGDGAVYLERLIVGGRHVEVQLLGDELGDVVSLGERDCSIQRRHQKLVEESPAPGLSRDTRQSLHDAAVRVARQVGLRNAATAEFLYHAETGEYWFLEVNARLQVEHGLTELITGLDLVHEQLRISAGHPLTESVQLASQRALDPAAHAFEARISAEDPAESFAPSPGRVGEWHEPGGPGVRVDAGVEAGAPVPPHYDPLLAKLMVVAPDRSTALARMRRALGELRVTGVQTTLPFHRWLFAQEEFAQASFDTDHVTRHWEPGPIRAAAALRAAEAAARAGQNTAARLRGQEIPASNGWGRAAHVEAVDRW
jgi:acetyl/propionyl-CoA carboxylase alpha subunit